MKLHYTDPFVAGYMVKEFGVLMVNSKRGIMEYHKFFDEYPETSGIYRVHPDSYHIFEPREGDKNIDGFIYNKEKDLWVYEYKSFGVTCKFQIAVSSTNSPNIDMRDGKHFFMPEVDND